MGVPTYLTVSRHGIYYLRWPLPQSLHPLGKASDIKVSLRTRDQREALRLSRYLAYVAETLTTRAAASDKEQLLYELHDPSAYVTPDVIADVSMAEVQEIGTNRVAIHGIKGIRPPTRSKL